MHIIVACLIGIACGIVTGILPGLHVNLVSTLLLASFPFLPFDGLSAATFIISIATTHTFLDAIPSIFLGAPDSSTALGVLPGHRYLLRGQGYMAVKLFAIGAFGGLILGVCAYPIFMWFTRLIALVPNVWIGWTILAIPVIMWIREKKKLPALLVIVLASSFGYFGFNFTDPLFPMLSGLFGASTLLFSLFENTTIPLQTVMHTTALRWRDAIQATVGGLIAGGLTAILPGVGAAHASVIGMLLAYGTGDHGFLILTGAIGTTNFFLSLAAYDAIGKARNGALLAATTIQPSIPWQLGIGAALLAGGLGFMLVLVLGKHAARLMSVLPYRTLTICVLVFVGALVIILNGFFGVMLFVTGAAIGLMSASAKTARAHAMSCILVPVGLRMIGIG